MGEPSVPLWAFMALIGGLNLLGGAMLMRLWKAVDGNTAAVTQLAIELPTKYATKGELKEVHEYARERTHGLGNEIHNHQIAPLEKAHRT